MGSGVGVGVAVAAAEAEAVAAGVGEGVGTGVGAGVAVGAGVGWMATTCLTSMNCSPKVQNAAVSPMHRHIVTTCRQLGRCFGRLSLPAGVKRVSSIRTVLSHKMHSFPIIAHFVGIWKKARCCQFVTSESTPART